MNSFKSFTVWIFASILRKFADMLLRCPICEKRGLIESPGTQKVSERAIVHNNDHYIHFKIGENHFLARTAMNIHEELGLQGDEKRLVLN